MHRVFRVTLMCLRIAKVGHHSVAKKFRDMTVEAFDRIGCHLLIVGNDIAPLLGIELMGDFGRADQIAEQHGQMAAFAAG